jgi:hypothetical protein
MNVVFFFVTPIRLMPTQHKQRMSFDMISKRLDRFLLVEGFMNNNLRVRHWVESWGDSYHFPILVWVASRGKETS